MSSCFTEAQVQEAFLAAPPLISQQIKDLTIKHPSWMRDLFQLEEFPRGNGSLMQQLIFRGQMPQIERGFDNWRKVNNLSGCDPCAGPDCSYNWTPMGGHALERKITQLMSRDFRSPKYCVKEIQDTAQFKQVFSKIVQNLYAQVDFFKSINIAQNFLTMIAKKYVVDSGGPKPNPTNPYVYRNIGAATLSALNIEMLTFFYEQMRRLPDAVPYDVIDGAPIYALECSDQLLARLYRDDQNLRQDVRFSGLANDNLMKYNFMSTIRGMFIAAPILYPRRFNIVAGEPVEVLPFVNNVPGEVGAYSYLNPQYESATHEEVLIHGRYPFKILFRPTETSLGENTSFGPEFSFMNNWIWVNPLTECDPLRRDGFFVTSAEIAIAQDYSEAVYAILVSRPSITLAAMYTPVAECPPTPPACDNEVPDALCPCPLVTSIQSDPFNANNYIFTFATPIAAVPTDSLTLSYDSGIWVTGVVEEITSDGLTLRISFTTDLPNGSCAAITNVACSLPVVCSAYVQNSNDCRSAVTNAVDLILSNMISAGVGDDVVVYFGDCTTAEMTITAINGSCLTYTMEYATGYGPTDDPTGSGTTPTYDVVCNRGGISRVCVPTATNAACGACDVTSEPCSVP